MQYDGTVWINTEIDPEGMEDGFRRMKDNADFVATSVRKAGNEIQETFAKLDVSKPIENAKIRIKSLEQQLAAITAEYDDAVSSGEDKNAERLAAKRTAIYDRLEIAREKLAVEVAAAAKKEAAAEEKASQKAVAAAEREAATKRKTLEKQFEDLGRPARRFNSRLREIVSGALVFNVLSAGLRSVTTYFGQALMANNEFAYAMARLKGSLMTAFQPIYEAVLPALITLINWITAAIQVVARFFAALTGKSYTAIQANAEALNNQAGAIENVGQEAKEAEKYLAGFDEINRMMAEQNYGSGNAGGGIVNGPVFDEIDIPSEWENIIDSLAMRIKDIFFTWDDLNAEIIAEKLITALTAITGGLIGFALGGPKGALIGMLVGAGLGVALSTIIFDGDGTLSQEELCKSLIAGLSIIGGAAIGFVLGGPGGALIGATIGTGITFALLKTVFNGDNELSAEELLRALSIGLSTIGGAAIGFVVGGPGGAAIGAVLGAGIGFKVIDTIFDGDGSLSSSEIIDALIIGLSAIAGGIIGFYAGGPIGAAIGVAVGAGIGFAISKIEFGGDSTLTLDQVLQALIAGLMVIGGAAIGFSIGGVPGAIIGALIGLGLAFTISNTTFDAIEAEYDGLNRKIDTWSKTASQTTESQYLAPTKTGFQNLGTNISDTMQRSQQTISDSFAKAAKGTEDNFVKPTEKWFTNLENTTKKFADNSERNITDQFERAEDSMEKQFFAPVSRNMEDLRYKIIRDFQEAVKESRNAWSGFPTWFKNAVTDIIIIHVNQLTDAVTAAFMRMVAGMRAAIDALIGTYYDVLAIAGSFMSYRSARNTAVNQYAQNLYMVYPEIPNVARGTVLPKTERFSRAEIGHQSGATDTESLMTMIQETITVLMEDMVQSNLAGQEATVSLLQQILEAILGIELDGETLSRAVTSYNRKMAMVRGG